MAEPPASPPPHSDDTGMGRRRESPPSTPRWVKLFGFIAIVLVVLLVVLHLTGHSPGGHGSHTSSAEHGSQQP